MEKSTKFREVAALWLAWKKPYVKKSTYATYDIHIQRQLLPSLGERADVGEEDVQAFVNGKLAGGLSPKTVRDLLVILKMILRFGAKKGLMPCPPMDIVFPTEGGRREKDVLTLAQQKQLLSYVREHFSFRNLGICICLNAGLRIGEVCALQWKDLDADAGVIHIGKTLQRIYRADGEAPRTELLLDRPKTRNSVREVPMTRELLALVRPLKKLVRADYYVLSNAAAPIEPRTYRAYFYRLLRQLGLPKMRFHGLRHSFATRCIESKCDYKTVSVLLGHASISTTLNLYVHPDLEQKRRCVNAMGKLLKV